MTSYRLELGSFFGYLIEKVCGGFMVLICDRKGLTLGYKEN